MPQQEGPIPCPRDRDLERAVWDVIETIPSCPTAPAGLGGADVRVDLARQAPTEIIVRRGEGRPLDFEAIASCIRTPMAAVTGSLNARRMIVSFRFELTSEP